MQSRWSMIYFFSMFFTLLSFSTPVLASRENDPRADGSRSTTPQPASLKISTTVLDHFYLGHIATPGGHFEESLAQSPVLQNIKKFRFNPFLDVNPSRGSLRTKFSIPLPPNLTHVSSLVWFYESFQPQDQGYGIGWSLSLPRIVTNDRGKAFPKFYAEQLADSELVEISNFKLNKEKRDYLQEISLPLLGRFSAFDWSQVTLYRPLMEKDFYHFYKLGERGWVVLGIDGSTYLFNEKGRLFYQMSPYGAGRIGISFVWDHGQLVQVKEGVGGIGISSLWTLDLRYEDEAITKLPQEVQGEFVSLQRLQSIKVEHHQSKEH